MAEGGSSSRITMPSFLKFLTRVRTESQLSVEDVNTIKHFAVNKRQRAESDLNRSRQPLTIQTFMRSCGPTGTKVPVYDSTEGGLRANGWAEIPGSIELGKGAYGKIHLAYKLSEFAVPIESRHLCAVKMQSLRQRDVDHIWNEIKILRACVHENIIDYFTHYVVESDIEIPHVHILMEYACAGNLHKEMSRHEGFNMEEPNARYYALQIIAGVQYLHSKWIVHFDLHAKNIVLKYNPDLSKTCMICDFGISLILMPGSDPSKFHVDVSSINSLIARMLGFPTNPIEPMSPEAEALIKAREPYMLDGNLVSDEPDTVAELLEKFAWFRGPVSPSYPQPPTPLLKRRVIDQIGYLPEAEPEVTSSWDNVSRTTQSLQRSGSSERGGRVRIQETEGEHPHVQSTSTAVGEEQRPSLGHRIRRSMSSIGHAIIRPFQRATGRRRDSRVSGRSGSSRRSTRRR